MDTSASTHPGVYVTELGAFLGNWFSHTGDVCFYVYVAGGAPAATLSRKVGKSLTATLSRSAALTRSYLDAGFTATLSFVGAMTKRMTLLRGSFTATLFPGGGGGSVMDDFYSETNQDNYDTLYSGFPDAGQTFVSSGGTLVKSTFYLSLQGSPTGNAVSKLYALSGGLPTGSPLATSDPLDVTTLTSSFVLRDFTFMAQTSTP